MKKFALVGVIALVVGGLGTLFNWQAIASQTRGNVVNERVTISNDEINTIDINSDVGEVNLFQIDGDTIQVDFSGGSRNAQDDLFTLYETDDRLEINVNHGSKMINISIFPSWISKNATLNIGVPESFRGRINASVEVGTIQVDDLMIDQFNGIVNVGKINGNRLDLNDGRAEVDVGEIDLSNVTGEWYLETAVGEIKLTHHDWQGRIEAHSDLGDILIRIAEEPEDYALDLNTNLGSVKGVDHSYINSRSEFDAPSLRATSDIGNITLEWGR